jgi:uncharacterized protein (TIGR03000 family)
LRDERLAPDLRTSSSVRPEPVWCRDGQLAGKTRGIHLMARQRLLVLAVSAAVAASAAAGAARAADPQPEPGRGSDYTAGSPYSFRPLDPYWSYRAMPTPPYRNARLGASPIFMTSLQFPGVYGAYSFGATPMSMYNQAGYFTPDATPPGFVLETAQGPLRIGDISPRAARIDVAVPTRDAELTFDNTPTVPTGMTREFVTPALLRGGKYVYHVRVSWVDDGVRRMREKNVYVEPGDRLLVDLTTSAGTYEGPSLRVAPEVERPAALEPRKAP